MGPTLGFDTKQRNSFFAQIWCFYNKNKILTILFIVNCEKITLAHNQQAFCKFKWGKKGACSSPISMPGTNTFVSCPDLDKRRQKVFRRQDVVRPPLLALPRRLWLDRQARNVESRSGTNVIKLFTDLSYKFLLVQTQKACQGQTLAYYKNWAQGETLYLILKIRKLRT